MKLVIPRSFDGRKEAIIVNTSGGVTGGDRLALDVTASGSSQLTLTTQAAERAYRAQPDEIGEIRTHLTLEDDATLHWMPQELILYDRSALSRSLDVQMSEGARFLMVEPVAFGRAAMGETLSSVRFHDRIRIERNGTPVFIDGTSFDGDLTTHLNREAIGGGAGAMALVVMVAPQADQKLGTLRQMLPKSAGVSLLAADILVIRHLAFDSFDLRRTLVPALEYLAETPLPASWRL